MTTNNRKFTRFYYKMRSEFRVNKNIFVLEELINLSIGGCLLPVAAVADPGDKCFLKILLGDDSLSPVVSIEGRIIRVDSDTTAVKFIKIDPESLEHLHKIAQYNASDPKRVEEEIKKHPGLF